MTDRPQAIDGLRFWPVLGLVALTMALFNLAFPPWSLWPCVLIAPVPFAIACRLAERARVLFVAMLLGGIGSWLLLHVWIIEVTLPGYLALSLYGGCFLGLEAL